MFSEASAAFRGTDLFPNLFIYDIVKTSWLINCIGRFSVMAAGRVHECTSGPECGVPRR